MTPLKLIFMGTPEFACPCLQALLASEHEVAAVVTQPDRPSGRGRKMVAPPVKKLAAALGCALLQPDSIKTAEVRATLEHLAPDLIVVIAYGQILPASVLALPRHGAINVHASLLPHYRGAAPIQWVIRNQERRTGITTMQMDTGLDTGDILLQSETLITDTETAQTLHDRLSQMGATVLMETLTALQNGSLRPIPQDPALASHAPTLKKADGHIDWQAPATTIDAQVRAFNPWPGAFCFWDKTRLKILGTVALPHSENDSPPGTVIRGFDNELRIATGSGALSITNIQSASGKRQSIETFLRGCQIPIGTRLT